MPADALEWMLRLSFRRPFDFWQRRFYQIAATQHLCGGATARLSLYLVASKRTMASNRFRSPAQLRRGICSKGCGPDYALELIFETSRPTILPSSTSTRLLPQRFVQILEHTAPLGKWPNTSSGL